MSWQRIELNMIPDTKVLPVVHASQFDSNRSISFQMFTGEDEWTIPEGLTIELHCRKVDDNIVTLAPSSVDGSVITFITTEQLTACSGQNKCELSFIDADDLVIGSLNFILDVEPDPLKGGLTSASSIYDLTHQIEDIAEEVIGEDYYNKTETDALLADKADKSELPDMTDYYTKTQTDTLLNAKANTSDLAPLASKAELTQAISDEDTAVKNWVSSQFATQGYVASNYYNKLQVDALIDNIFPTLSASGPIASFITALNKNLVSVTTEEGATEITLCGVNFFDEEWEKGTINQTTGEEEPNAYISRSGFIPIAPDTRFYYGYSSQNNARGYYYDSNKNYIGTFVAYANNSFVSDVNAAYLRVSIGDVDGIPQLTINYPSTDTSYHAHEGNTVPVADATTLTTLSGVNNVFADSGDVTVQYKYMSM